MTPVSPPDDDDRTVIRGPSVRPGPSGFMSHTLPVGTQVGEFEITGLIGEGGFGIVYLAHDRQLQRQVAVKEYMPSSLAARAQASMDVSVKSERHRDTFEAGLKSFVNEARLLARFNHPALVKVFRFWEANQTAYMAMPYYEGPTLKAALAELGNPPEEEVLRGWLRPLLDALAVMHRERCYHRDIAPDNILLTSTGPLLLDFGAARRVIGDMTHALTVVLKPGYAPIEQYGESTAMTQGPWTDLYALASVVYCAITGRAPVSSVERLMGDSLEPLSVKAAGFYSESLLGAVDAALAVRPADRPQSVAEFRALLNAGMPVSDSAASFRASAFDALGSPTSGFGVSVIDPPPSGAPSTGTLTSTPTSVPAPATLPPLPALTAERPAPLPPAASAAPVAPVGDAAPRRRPIAWLAAGGLGAALLLAWALWPRSMPPVAEPAAPVAPPVSAPAPEPAPAPSPAPEPAPAPTPEPAPAPATPATPVEPAPAPAEPPPAVTTPIETPQGEPNVEPKVAPKAESNVEPKATPKPVPVTRPKPTPPVAEPAPPPARSPTVRPTRCSDILQKASLEPLTSEEAAYLRRECR